jgi:heme-degrading monooxygenase HmoA
MLVRVWEYDVSETRAVDFERVYGADGEWASLFSLSAGYLGTQLFVSRGDPRRYLTVDRFADTDDWHAFLAEHGDAYARLDAASAALTLGEREVVAAEVP